MEKEQEKEFGGDNSREPRQSLPVPTDLPALAHLRSETVSDSFPVPAAPAHTEHVVGSSVTICWVNAWMEKEKASRLVDYRDMNLVQLLTKKIRLGHQETRLARSLEWTLLSDTSEKDCFLQLWGQSPPLLPSLPYAVSSHSQQGAGREIGHLLSLSSSKAWSPLNIGAPRQLAPAPLCFSPLSPGNVSTLKASRYSPLLTTVVPAQTHTASSPLDKCPVATGIYKVSFCVHAPLRTLP